MVTIAMTGCDGGRMGEHADVHVNVSETPTPRIQEVHRTIMHAICSIIEDDLRTG
jgi:phosphoheptose isomerase